MQFDTTLRPDYYSVKIGVSEYLNFEGEGKKRKANVIPLDTVMKNLQDELIRIGFHQTLTKSSIAEKTNRTNGERIYFYDRILFQVTFDFDISTKDSVEYLFKSLNKETLQSLYVSPKFKNSTLEAAKDLLISKGLEETKKYAQKIAAENKQQIIKQTNTYLGFYAKNQNNSADYNIYGQRKEFVINLDDVDYSLNITYAYLFEDK